MKFSMPIGKISEGKITQRSAQELYALNIGGHGGFYPIGSNNAYHGGLHFEDDNAAVLSIADGTIIAYRYNTDYITEKTDDGVELNYSNCFVLIRHEYETPKGQKFVFYSHYNHLAPWNECKDKPYRPSINTKPGYKINRKRTLCTSTDASTVTSETIGINELVAAVPVDSSPGWAKLDNKERYILIKNNFASPVTLVEPPTLDEIVTCEISIKAGMLIGYTGLCEAEGARGYRATHVEVFAGDDTEDFIKNVKGDGKPTLLKIAKNKVLQSRTKVNDIAALQKFQRSKGTVVEFKADGDGEWVKVLDKKLVAEVEVGWLNNKYPSFKHYTARSEYVEQINLLFPGTEVVGEDSTIPDVLTTMTLATAFSLVKVSGTKRVLSLDVSAPVAKEYWVKRSLLKGNKELTSDCEGFDKDPDEVVRSDVGNVPYECAVASQTTTRERGVTLHQVKVEDIGGWIKETDVTPVSPFDWEKCGFSILKESDGSVWDATDENSQVNYDNMPEFFKKIFEQIDTNKSGVIEESELREAMAKSETAHKLSRLICYHQTEWIEADASWQEMLNKIKSMWGQGSADNINNRIQQMCWWAKVDGLPSKIVFHWHPVAFVEHMQLIPFCSIDSRHFFEQYDAEFPERKLSQEQKTNLERMFSSIEEYYNNEQKQPNVKHLAYMMATAKHETAHTFAPIDEYGSSSYFEQMYDPVLGMDEARRAMAIQNGNINQGDGVTYHGRGYVQLTWHNNYERAGDKFGVDLVSNPELAKNHELAAKIMLFGCETGMFTGKKLGDYINDAQTDFLNARRVINGLDKAERIKGYAEKMQKCIRLI